jgi:5'-phosphate synthase pdxT subunit
MGGGNSSVSPAVNILSSSLSYGEHHIGGLDVNTCRNFFGRQLKSFSAISKSSYSEFQDFPCVFIRAPAIMSVGDNVDVLATVHHEGRDIIVAVRQGSILGTCFHPELSNDRRIHEFFLSMVETSRYNIGPTPSYS